MFYRFWRALCVGLAYLLFRVEIRGKDRVPRHGVYILAPSHRSLLDIPFAQLKCETVAGLTVSTAGRVMTMTSPGPQAVQATFTKGDCSDGMSDLKYPYTVVLTWGAESLKGCGFNTAEEPHEGE